MGKNIRQPPYTFTGHVTNLKKNLDKIIMQLETSEGNKELEMPITIKNDFELIPYQNALLNQKVQYSVDEGNPNQDCIICPRGCCDKYSALFILSGSLNGKSYKFSEKL